jgi:CheY-like chemotaxis protein/ABC-type transporter Mla MlaB component
VTALRVVVVDDHEPIRRLLSTLLSDAGHVVVAEAAEGRAGVRDTVAAEPDVVVMDWSMPGLDGVAATREIRARCPGVAVIAFSSAGDPGVREAFLRAGARSYVDKADVDGLLAAVRAVASARGAAPPGRSSTGRAADEPLTWSVRAWPALARVYVTLRGALRGDTAGSLVAAVAEHAWPGNAIILDLSEITAIDEHGVAALQECRRLAETRGADVELQDPSPIARRALRTPPG